MCSVGSREELLGIQTSDAFARKFPCPSPVMVCAGELPFESVRGLAEANFICTSTSRMDIWTSDVYRAIPKGSDDDCSDVVIAVAKTRDSARYFTFHVAASYFHAKWRWKGWCRGRTLHGKRIPRWRWRTSQSLGIPYQIVVQERSYPVNNEGVRVASGFVKFARACQTVDGPQRSGHRRPRASATSFSAASGFFRVSISDA
jgi:hypothetical protein